MTTTPSTASQAPEVLTKQVATWRAEVARLNDLIAHATGVSQAPAVSIDDEEFSHMLAQAAIFWMADPLRYALAREKLVAHIDAKRAQEREEAIGALAIAFEKMLCAAVGRDWSTSGISASSLVEALRSRAEKAEARATEAEAKLAELQMEVETMLNDAVFFMGAIELHALDGVALGERLKELLYQSQADESGLPG